MQLAHLPFHDFGGAFDLARLAQASRTLLALEVARHDLQVVEPAQQILDILDPAHQAQRRHAPELVDQLQNVPELFRRDAHPVQPVDREQRTGFRHGRAKPVRAACEPPPEQRHTRPV